MNTIRHASKWDRRWLMAGLARFSILVVRRSFRLGRWFASACCLAGLLMAHQVQAAVPAVVINCPSDILTDATGPNGAVVYFYATAYGGCSPLTMTYDPPSGSLFPWGTTTVSVTAQDNCGNSAGCSFTVTVNPHVPITINCPSNITTAATGPNGAVVYYYATAYGGCDALSMTYDPPSGSVFPFGTTMVTATASDQCGNTNSCIFAVTVNQHVPITINCPSNIMTDATGPNGAVVYFYATAYGGCDALSLRYDPASGSVFPFGTTMVTATASDQCGNSNSCIFAVTVNQHVPITINCPSNITNAATGPNGAVVYFYATAYGGCDALSLRYNPPSGSVFPFGTTMVTATASDQCGNSNSCVFAVTVNQHVPITINCPSNITTAATGPNGAVVYFYATAYGGCDALSLTYNPPSGSVFPFGTTMVTATASDQCGNSNSCIFAVTVNQHVPITINCPSNITNAATGPNGAVVYYYATAYGGCDALSLTYNPPSGSVFPFGTTMVTATATDQCGNSNSCIFAVTVNQHVPVTINCPSNITTAATGPNGAVVYFYATAYGGCDALSLTYTPPSGSLFPAGTTTVLATASDQCGNSNSCAFMVTVNSNVLVTMNCPSNITTTATGPNGAVVYFNATAYGGCTPPSVTYSRPSGSLFPAGTTPVLATASDQCGNSNTCSFLVTVNPQTVSPITILEQPQSQVAAPGTNVTLTVVATGPAPLLYQWQLFGTNLPGASASSLYLYGITSDQEGAYNVVVSDGVDQVNSDPAFVFVQAPLVTIDAAAGQGGSLAPGGVFSTNAGSDLLLVAQPDAGFEVDRWYVDGSPVQDGGTSLELDDLQADVNVSNSFRLANPPAIPFQLSINLLTNPPQAVLTVTGDPGEEPTIQVSSDLVNWVGLTILTNFTGQGQYVDPLPAYEVSQRFYRVCTGTPWPAMSFVGNSTDDSTASAALVLPADLSIPAFSWASLDTIVGESGGSGIVATYWQMLRDANGQPQSLQFSGAVRDALIAGTVYLSNALNQATVTVTKTIQGVQLRIRYTLSLLTCKILADSNRDGVVDDNDDTNKTIFTTGPNGWGATILVNCDDDDGDHIPDNWPGGPINGVYVPPDDHVNGAADLLDIGQVVVKKTGIPAAMLPDQLQIQLQITLPQTPQGTPVNEPHYFDNIPPEKRVRLFLPTQVVGQDLQLQGTDREILGPSLGTTAVFQKPPPVGPPAPGQYDYALLAGAGRMMLGIEGIEFAAAVDVRLQYYYGALPLCSDRVRIKTAPFLLLANNNPVTRTVVSSANFAVGTLADNSAFTTDFDTADNVNTTVIPAATSSSDVWAQDEWEIGFNQVPTVGGVRTRTVVLDLPRNRGLRSYAIQNFLSPTVGVFHELKGNFQGSELTYGGNIECSGPVTVTKGGTVYDYRLGRIILGQSFTRRPNGTAFDPQLLDFFMSQGVQDPILIDTGWLGVGHVDEVIGLVPDASTPDPRDFRMLIGSAARGRTVLNNIAAANNGVHIMNGRGTPWEMTVGQFKADTRGIQTVNNQIQTRYIDPIRRQLERELNIALTEVPALYYTPVNTDPAADSSNTGTAQLRTIRVTPANTPFDLTLWVIEFEANPAGGVRFSVSYQRAYLGGPLTTVAGKGTTGADFDTGLGVVIPQASWVNPATAAVGDAFYFYTSKGALWQVGAWFPAVQNAQVANDVVLAPDPQGPVIAGQDVLRADYEAALAGLGLTFSYPNANSEFAYYHRSHGEVHCGSNRFSDPYPQPENRWWMQPPPTPAP